MAGKGKRGAVLVTFDADQKNQVEKLAKFLTQDQLADYFGICRKTFYNILDRDPEVEQCFNRGRAACHAAVAQSLVNQAIDGNVPAQVFYLKTRAGWKEPPTAIEMTGAGGGPIQSEDVTNDAASFARRMADLAARAVAVGIGEADSTGAS